jgi:hypothetical protein
MGCIFTLCVFVSFTHAHFVIGPWAVIMQINKNWIIIIGHFFMDLF